MKTMAFAVALLMSGAVLAQDYTQPEPDAATTHGATTQSEASHAATPTTLASTTTPVGSPVVQPSNADPEQDARGIAVISDPAAVPAGFNGISSTAVGGPLVDPATGETIIAADDSYPPCTAEVTDNCLQTYERGRSPQ